MKRLGLKISTLFILAAITGVCSLSIASEINLNNNEANSKEKESLVLSSKTIFAYARALGLDIERYGKFTSMRYSTFDLPFPASEGMVNIPAHNAYIEYSTLLDNGEQIPVALLEELQGLFVHNQHVLSKYAGIPESEITEYIDRLDALSNIYFFHRIREFQQKSESQYLNNIPNAGAITIKLSPEQLADVSSGEFDESYMQIYQFAQAFLDSNQSMYFGYVRVEFTDQSSDEVIATQDWFATRLNVRPISGSLVCDFEVCDLNSNLTFNHFSR